MNNNGGKKHIAKSGLKVGQFVACSAENCQNGGEHVSNKVLDLVILWKSEAAGRQVPVRDISLKHVHTFEALPVEVKAKLEGLAAARALKLKAAKVKRDSRRAQYAEVGYKYDTRASVKKDSAVRREAVVMDEVAMEKAISSRGSDMVVNSDGVSVKRLYSSREASELKALFTDALGVLQSDRDGFFLAVGKFKHTFASNPLAARHFNTSWRDAVIKGGAAMYDLSPEQRVASLHVFSGFMSDARNHVPLNTSRNKSKARLDEKVKVDRAAAEAVSDGVKWAEAAAAKKKGAGGKFKKFLASWSYTEEKK